MLPINILLLIYSSALKSTFIIPVYKDTQVIVQNIGFIMKPGAFFFPQTTILHFYTSIDQNLL